ncbi:MAG: type II secretion system protein E, partial [Methanoregula sp.]|nr:type II secretion system protein E [Methanoregula sp.]
LYSWDVKSDTTRRVSEESKVLSEIAILRGWSETQVTEELKKREEFLRLALDVPPPDILDLANAMHSFGE